MPYHSTYCITSRHSNCGDPACTCCCHRNKKIETMLEKVREEGRGLNDWEKMFVESLTDQWENTGSMSRRQEEILERVYTEKTP